MEQQKINNDIISEEEFTRNMKSVSSAPESDSPGDSEFDETAEITMGLEYEPMFDQDQVSGDEAGHESMELLSATEREEILKVNQHPIVELPETSKVISSDLPAHARDRDTPSDTN